jgi:type IV pilus assembly protein PilM
MGKKFLTLDIGAATVALAEYEAGSKGALTLVNYGTATLSAPLDSGDAGTILVPAIMDIVREKGMRPGPVALSLSGNMVFPRFAAIPSAGGPEKFEQMIRYEIEQNVPFPMDEMVCDRQVLGDTENGDKAVMIVAAKVDQVEAITDAVASAGFRPELVDVAPLAFTNAVNAATGGDEGCKILLDIGAKTTSLIIVEGDKLYNRSIPIAGNNINRDIAQAVGCTPAEAEQLKCEKGYVSLGGVAEDEDPVADSVSKVCRAIMSRLVAEISRSVNFYRSQQGGGAPQKVFLTGGTALLPQIDRFFADALHVDVEFFNPFSIVAAGPAVDQDSLATAGAFLTPTVGLALHMSGAARLAINLMPPSLIAARAEKARIPVAATAGVMFVGALVLALLAVGRQSEVVQTAYDAVDGRLRVLKGYETKLKAAEKSVEETKASADALKDLMGARFMMCVRLDAVRKALAPGRMWVEKWEPGRLTIRGWKDVLDAYEAIDAANNEGRRKTASEIVAQKLKGLSSIIDPDSVRIADMTTIGKNASVEQFTVELKFK